MCHLWSRHRYHWLHTHIYITHTHTHMCIHSCTCTHTHTDMCAQMHAHAHTNTHRCMHACMDGQQLLVNWCIIYLPCCVHSCIHILMVLETGDAWSHNYTATVFCSHLHRVPLSCGLFELGPTSWCTQKRTCVTSCCFPYLYYIYLKCSTLSISLFCSCPAQLISHSSSVYLVNRW